VSAAEERLTEGAAAATRHQLVRHAPHLVRHLVHVREHRRGPHAIYGDPARPEPGVPAFVVRALRILSVAGAVHLDSEPRGRTQTGSRFRSLAHSITSGSVMVDRSTRARFSVMILALMRLPPPPSPALRRATPPP